MTEWKIRRGTQEEKPSEIDVTSSKSVVYLRRNIKEIEVENSFTHEKFHMWEYEERLLTPDEYVQFQLIQESTRELKSFQRQKVIDEYTAELIEEGNI